MRQVLAADLLIRSGLDFDLAELGEIDLGPGQQVEDAAASDATGGRGDQAGDGAGHHALDVLGEVFLTMRPAGPLAATLTRSTPSSGRRRGPRGEAWTAADGQGRRQGGGSGHGCGRSWGRSWGGEPPGRQAPRSVRRASRAADAAALPDSTLINSPPSLTLRAELDQDFLDHAGGGGRHVHGRLVGLQGADGVVDLDGVAHLDEEVDDRYVGKVADIRHLTSDHATAGGAAAGAAAERRGAGGSRRSGGRAAVAAGTGLDLDQQRSFADLAPIWTRTSLTTPATVPARPWWPCRIPGWRWHQSTLMVSPTFDEEVDDRHIGEIADIGDFDFG